MATMPRRSTRHLVDKALGGRLDDMLREHGRPGPSFEDLARTLDRQGLYVSSETLRRWAAALDAVAEPEAATK